MNNRVGRRALAPPGGVTTANIFGSTQVQGAPASARSGDRLRSENEDVTFKLLKLALVEAVVSSRNKASMCAAVERVLGSTYLQGDTRVGKIEPLAPLPIPVRSVTPVKSVPLTVLGEGGTAGSKENADTSGIPATGKNVSTVLDSGAASSSVVSCHSSVPNVMSSPGRC